jgi:hypothetical protein
MEKKLFGSAWVAWGKLAMRKLGFLWGFVFVVAGTAAAQANPQYASSLLSGGAMAPSAATYASGAPTSILFAGSPTAAPNFSLTTGLAPSNVYAPESNSDALPASPEPEPQTAQGVYQNFDWEGYVGYTYVRFFEVPGNEFNTNGANFSVQYYFKPWIAFDGEFVATFGSQLCCTSKFLMGMGGIRVRRQLAYGIEGWAHILGGGSHYVPQTAYGNGQSLAYELGGGVDVVLHNSRRMAYRLAVDAAGTSFFNTYQVSPKVSAGVIFKF